MRAFVGDGPLLTDDRPLVEYHHWLPRPEEQPPLNVSALKGDVNRFIAARSSDQPMTTRPIETVFLDAGGVLCHPSWTRVAAALVRHGATVTAAALAAAEQKATRDIDDAHTIGTTDDRARGWLYFNLVLQHAGVTQNAGTDAALAELRDYHRHDNLWEHVEPDVDADAGGAARPRAAARGGLERERPPQAPVRSARSDQVVRPRPRFTRVGRRETRSAPVPNRARAVARRRRAAPCTSAISITWT